MYINTERLTIRTFQESDWKDLFAYTKDAHVMHFIPEEPLSEDQAKEFVNKHSSKDASYVAVVLNRTGTLIGHLSFAPCFGDFTYEIGWIFNPSYYNQGFATEAALSLVTHAFKYMNVHRIIATCQPENPASYHVMEKIGMRREGHFKKCIPHQNDWWDEYYYAILREEFLLTN
ncbi:GNAT family N-acetyltransferase [Alkalicoccobacillus gibsonii]|uniref:GNAT family N-acetyltransferase n=1 Tax=Alkalicoccobacillus gibsonii TaxID=79881 RepID=UPI003F7C4595